MESPAPTTLADLDTPLPPEISGRGHGWFTRYRTWPVFSPGWARGRVRAYTVVALIVLAFAMGPLLAGSWADLPLGGVAQVIVQVFVPLLGGPWLGVWVRRRHAAPAREWQGLAAMMGALVVAMLLFHQYGAEPMKQALAEATGHVDAQGQRKRVMMAIGVVVATPEDVAAEMAAGPKRQLSPQAMAINAVSSALTTFWLAGGAALWGWRRERAGLATLQAERALAQAQAQRREAELRLSVLAAQVEPHFLFNTLAGVRSAIATDPTRASEMIDRLVDYLRAAIPRLRATGAAEATLGAQLEIVHAYLGLMAARMPRLTWQVDADPALLPLPCPPLMLISLAENAVKHGVEPKIGLVHVAVRAQLAGDGTLEVTVADDGAGFGSQAAGSGLGLANIRERLQQIYAGRAALTLRARAEGGVAATLTLPVE